MKPCIDSLSTKPSAKVAIFAIVALCMFALEAFYYYSSTSASKSILVLAALFAVLLIALVAFIAWRKKKEDSSASLKAFAIALLLTGTAYGLLFTPGTVPDETFHYENAYRYSNLLFGIAEPDGQLTMRDCDAAFLTEGGVGTYLSLDSITQVVEDFSVFAETEGVTQIAPVVGLSINSNPPQARICAALGIAFARLLDLSPYLVFCAGRLFNFLFFAALCVAAVRLTPIGKNVFMVVALLPMALHVAASYSYDVAAMGFSFLLTALCLRAICGEGQLSKKLIVAIAVVAALLVPCKTVYTVLVLLVLLIPSRRFANKRMAICFKLGVLALAAATYCIFSALNSVIATGGALGSGHRTGGTTVSFGDILSNPCHALLVLLGTLYSLGDWQLGTALGNSLGWFQSELTAPWWFILLFALALLVAALRAPNEKGGLSKLQKVAAFCMCGVIWFGVLLSMWTGHTFTTEDAIQGVQGRYILPILPLLLLSLRPTPIMATKDYGSILIIAVTGLNFMYAVGIYASALMCV